MDIQLDKGIQLDEDQLKAALKEIGKEFIKEARKLLNEPDNAADGSLPHTETGTLARSLRMQVKKKNGQIWLRVVSNTRYSVALFAGSTRETASGAMVKVRGRPLFDIVLERLKPRMKAIIAKAAMIKTD